MITSRVEENSFVGCSTLLAVGVIPERPVRSCAAVARRHTQFFNPRIPCSQSESRCPRMHTCLQRARSGALDTLGAERFPFRKFFLQELFRARPGGAPSSSSGFRLRVLEARPDARERTGADQPSRGNVREPTQL